MSRKKVYREKSMEMSFLDFVFSWFREVDVSKRLTQAGYHSTKAMRRCIALKWPYTGPCFGGRAKKTSSCSAERFFHV